MWRCLRGAGGEAFVAGTDIAQFQQFSSGDDGVDYESRIDEGIRLVEQLPMPTVAVVEGWAVGGGLAIATACDFRLAHAQGALRRADRAHAGQHAVGAEPHPAARRLGACNRCAACCCWRRSSMRTPPWPAASCRPCTRAEALDAEVAALCDRLGALAPVTQTVVKEALRRQTVAAVADTDDLVRQCYGSEDFREGVDAFVNRRPPVWRGQ